VVSFSDGTSRDFSTDIRTLYTIVNGTDLATMNGRKVVASPTAPSNGTITVYVNFPGAYPVNTTVNIELVLFDRLLIQTYPNPTYSGAPATQILRQLQCSGVFERASVALTGVLSDGTTFVVTTASSISSTNTSAVGVDSANRVVYGVTEGQADIRGTFSGASSDFLTIQVSGATWITALTLTNPSLTSSTLKGPIGTQATIKVCAWL
jgi:hypothetical protein